MATNKDKILRIGSALLYRNGYERTSVDILISESGVSKSNFYYHFSSKEELCLKVIEKWIEGYKKSVLPDTICNKSLRPTDRIKALYEDQKSMLRNFDEIFGCPFGNMAAETACSNELFRDILSSFFNEWQALIADCIHEGMKSGEIRGDLAPKLIAELILCHLEGSLMMAKLHRSVEHLTLGAWTILEIIKPGIKTQ